MRTLTAILLLSASPLVVADATPAPATSTAQASIHWQYTLNDVVVTETGIDGQATHSLSLPVVDSFLQTIAVYADRYPPHFDNDAERADAIDKLTHLVIVLSALDQDDTVNVDVLRREAFAYNLACNLDMAGACERALQDYPRLLRMTPDEPAANYLYGAFLATLTPKQKEAVPYLEKSIKLGVAKANFTLGVLYLRLHDKSDGLRYLQAYSAAFPNDQKVKQLIAQLQAPKIQVQEPAGEPPP